ncbi:MAG: molybdopterin-dependent oxidoreductase, partial [Anaerolineae bacterium]|nr:molybdopterin-dependent oxidoreductase [Anaerolineae bacterium]
MVAAARLKPDDVVRTTCPYCGVGCQMNLHLRDGHIYRVTAPFDAAPNYGNLCVKGRFGTDYTTHPGRLRTPLIRSGGPGEFREATWEEALTLVSEKLAGLVRQHGGDCIATYACAKATNEDNYVFQKWVRAVMKTNNVDHCARLCHAGSVTALSLAIGSSAMSNSIAEMEHLDTFIVTGSNTTETHPVISLFLKKAVRQNGAKLIVIDPRQIELTDFATLWLRQKPGTDVAVYQAMAHVIVTEKLYNPAFISERTEGFEQYAESLEQYTPEWAEGVSGVPSEDIRQAARLYATAGSAAIYWGMGISQSTHGTDNALSLTNLALMTGQVGRPGTGLNPLRGQNNVQGCSDSGGLPNVYTAYQPVAVPEVRARFEQAWRTALPPEPGLTVTEMVDAALTGQIKAMVIMGEDPLMSEPNLAHARHAIEGLDLIVCIDIFMNETGKHADVILPSASFAEKDGTFTNSDRRVQRIRRALPPAG